MTINEIRNGDSMTVVLEGRLDTLSSPDLDNLLRKNYQSVTSLVVDCGKLDYISSAGLRVLLSARKNIAGKNSVRIVNASPLVKKVFEVTGLVDLFAFE